MKTILLALIPVFVFGCRETLKVEGIRPALGVTRGNEQVTISGSGFDAQQPFSVYFGSQRARSVSTIGSDRLIATTPAREKSGRVDVRIVAGDGREFVIRQGFEFTYRNDMAECVNIGRELNRVATGGKEKRD